MFAFSVDIQIGLLNGIWVPIYFIKLVVKDFVKCTQTSIKTGRKRLGKWKEDYVSLKLFSYSIK